LLSRNDQGITGRVDHALGCRTQATIGEATVSEGTDDSRLSAEGELALARLALEDGDLPHAAEHLAAAIASAPTHPDVHELLGQLATRGGIDLFPVEGHVSVGTVVARAHLLAAAGRPAEGLHLLAAASAHLPTADWAGVAWTQAADLPQRVDPAQLAQIFIRLCTALADPVSEAERSPLQPYLRLARHAVQTHPDHALLLGAASALARRLGETDLAVAWAEQGVRAEPSKLGEVWLGYAHRSAGRTEEALAALRRAADRDPDDLAIYADIAGTLADSGRLDEALRWIERALHRNPSFDCAVHTAHRLRYLRDGRLEHLVALADFQREHPDDSHEHTELAECCADRPWLGQLPPAGEAVINALRRLPASTGPIDQAHLRLTALEPPSAMVVITAAVPGLEVSVADVPAPDIRRPRRRGTSMLWRYEGTVAAPAVQAPSPAAAERLRRAALPGWAHPPAAYDRAVILATLRLDDLLGLLVHAPPPPDTGPVRALAERDPAQWVRCVQVWACLGLLHHRADEPWLTSTRRRVLVDLAWDVEDWVTEAAIFALVAAAWVDPAIRSDVAVLVDERIADAETVAAQRPVTVGWSLGQLALATPSLDGSAARRARRLIDARSAAAGQENPHPRDGLPPPPRSPGGPSGGPAAELARVTAPAADAGQLVTDPGSAPAAPRRHGLLRRWFTRRR
jgi:tetratricopeptide (TPR) repeat protein